MNDYFLFVLLDEWQQAEEGRGEKCRIAGLFACLLGLTVNSITPDMKPQLQQ